MENIVYGIFFLHKHYEFFFLTMEKIDYGIFDKSEMKEYLFLTMENLDHGNSGFLPHIFSTPPPLFVNSAYPPSHIRTFVVWVGIDVDICFPHLGPTNELRLK